MRFTTLGSKREKTLTAQLTAPPAFVEEEAAKVATKLRAKYPYRHAPNYGPPNHTAAAMMRQIQQASGIGIPDSEYTRYNRDVDTFILKYEKYLKTLYQYSVEQHLAQSIAIEIENSGNAPAEDVDVRLHFPDDCLLYEEFPEEPEEPEKPVEPRAMQDMIFSRMVPSLSDEPLHLNIPFRSARGFSIEKTNSYDVKDCFDRIKHGHKGDLPHFTLTFPSFASAASFQINYSITAANLPAAVSGTLNVVVIK